MKSLIVRQTDRGWFGEEVTRRRSGSGTYRETTAISIPQTKSEIEAFAAASRYVVEWNEIENNSSQPSESIERSQYQREPVVCHSVKTEEGSDEIVVLAEELARVQGRRIYLSFHDMQAAVTKVIKSRQDDPNSHTDSRLSGQEGSTSRAQALQIGLTGLAFSGGGIRSATFALGILQGLAKLDLLSRFDYLSTVSGGGFIGAWLAAWIKRDLSFANVEQQLKPNRVEQAKAKRRELKPKRRIRTVQRPDATQLVGPLTAPFIEHGRIVDDEPEPIHHIRSYSNYLAPRPGFLSPDTWALLAIYLRNLLINSLTILPATMILVILGRLIIVYFSQPANPPWYMGIGSLSLAVLLLMVSLFYISVELYRVGERRDAVRAAETQSTNVLKSRQLNKKYLHILIIWPMVAAAVLCAWIFSYEPKSDVMRLYGILPKEGVVHGWKPILQRQGKGIAMLFGVALACVVWTWHLTEVTKYGVRVRAFAISLMVALAGSGAVIMSLLLSVYLNSSDVPASGPLLIGVLCALLVGTVGFLTHFWHFVRILGAWEEPGWSFADRWGYSARLALVPALAGLTGGVLFYFVADTILNSHQKEPWLVAMAGPPLFIAAFVVAAIINVGLLGSCLEEDEREWWASLTGRLMEYAVGWLAFFAVVLYGVMFLATSESWMPGLMSTAAWTLLSQAGARANHNEVAGVRPSTKIQGQVRKALAVLIPPIFVVGLLILVGWLTSLLIDSSQIPEYIRQFNAEHGKPPLPAELYWYAMAHALALGLAAALVICSVLVLLAIGLVDINLFSLNAMYANRLIRCYLGASRRKRFWRERWGGEAQQRVSGSGGAPTGGGGRVERDENLITGFDFNDDIPLRSFRFEADQDKPYTGPLPLINTALNLVSGGELAWQDRKADSFVLTPLYCGSRSTGYRDLPDPKQDPDPVLTLGRAVAISGAAADPNMGTSQSLPQTILMTVFNARLGRWLQNPRWFQPWRGSGPSTGGLLFRELFGLTDETSKFVHLSDGGHFENLGAYELVRRRCRYVVVCDAGQDGRFAFQDLAGLIRKCRTDFGVRIDLDIGPIRPQTPTGLSRWHCAVGSIHYEEVEPNTPPGLLVYIKTSLTGDEAPDVQNYASLNSEFPHETTVDQFFDESQFESYRSLGYHIAVDVFGEAVARIEAAPRPPHSHDTLERTLRLEADTLAAYAQDARFACNRRWAELDEHVACLKGAEKLEDFVSPTFYECRAQILARAPQSFPRPTAPYDELDCDELQRLQDQLRDTANWYWEWENRSLFSEVRRRWFPPPPDIEINYKASVEAFSNLHATIRSDPHLIKLSMELYPELEFERRPAPVPRVSSEAEKSAELHAINQILIAMEQAWLGVRLDGYPEHPMNRGYLNVFRRCCGSRTIHRHWPTVRGSLNQEFVRFCERELRLPRNNPKVLAYDKKVAQKPHIIRALDQMQDEFCREWPGEGLISAYLRPPFQAWMVLGGAEVEEHGGSENHYACGIIALKKVAGMHEVSDLFVWIRGPYRNIGIGRRCLEQVYKNLADELPRGTTIRVRYPEPNSVNSGDRSRRDLWLNFFQHYNFTLQPLKSAQTASLILEWKYK
jgi:GNAT superfamily N-acetyltransferase